MGMAVNGSGENQLSLGIHNLRIGTRRQIRADFRDFSVFHGNIRLKT